MQRAWLFPLAVAVATGMLIVSIRPPAAEALRYGEPVPATAPVAESLRELDSYIDPDFGFSLAVPAGWSAIVAAGSEPERATLEPGYAVGFESPREHEGDVFSDYLMVEIMPGRESGLFETDGSLGRETVIDGRAAWRDALTLPADPADTRSVELVVRQAAMSGLGYTVGFYAIGEPSRLALLEDAFEAMLRTFRLPRRPFDVS